MINKHIHKIWSFTLLNKSHSKEWYKNSSDSFVTKLELQVMHIKIQCNKKKFYFLGEIVIKYICIRNERN